jgi:two-component system, NtrC family, sensor kinase
MTRPSRTGGKTSKAKGHNARPEKGRKTAKVESCIAPTATRVRRSVSGLSRDLMEARAQQAATAEILKVIASSPEDVQPVFDVILERAVQLCDARMGRVYRYDGNLIHLVGGQGLSVPGREGAQRPFPRPAADDTIVGRVMLSRRPNILADLDEDETVPPLSRQMIKALGARSQVTMPMLLAGEPIGAITLSWAQPKGYNDHQIALLKTFADQAVIAIENVRLFNETKEALERQTATAEVLSVISSSMADPKPVFERIVDSIERLFKCKQIGIFLTPGDGLLHLAAGRGANMEFVSSVYPLPVQQTAAPSVLGARQQVYYPDCLNGADVPPSLHRAAEVIGNFSDLLTPMRWEDRGVGMMTITREPHVDFNDKERALLKTFADQAVVAIENARLFNEVQAKTRDLSESLQQQTATADVLKVISRSAFDLQTVLDTLTESATRLCIADMGAIALKDERGFYHATNYNFSVDWITMTDGLRLQPGKDSLIGRTLLASAPIQITDVLEDQSYQFPDMQKAAGYRSLLGVPLMRGGEVIGVLFLGRKTVEPYTERQVELVSTFADQAVIAIGNVRLFEQVQARTRELAASLDDLRSAQDRLVQTEKLASLGQLTAGIAHEIKNPLNFVNNFSVLSAELTDELNELLKPAALGDKMRGEVDELTNLLKDNLKKVVQHGKRADSIVKNMLLHSREGSGEHRPTNINSLLDESLNLAYHGARAEKVEFNISLQRDFDAEAGIIELFPQEITRALLNLISNGVYAATKRKTESKEPGFEPTLWATTKNLGSSVEIRIRDNGSGIPAEVQEKMFNPFFTTKPAGEGTGLGLSMTHDIIVKQHGGRIDVETEPGNFTEFIIVLPKKSYSSSRDRGEA